MKKSWRLRPLDTVVGKEDGSIFIVAEAKEDSDKYTLINMLTGDSAYRVRKELWRINEPEMDVEWWKMVVRTAYFTKKFNRHALTPRDQYILTAYSTMDFIVQMTVIGGDYFKLLKKKLREFGVKATNKTIILESYNSIAKLRNELCNPAMLYIVPGGE